MKFDFLCFEYLKLSDTSDIEKIWTIKFEISILRDSLNISTKTRPKALNNEETDNIIVERNERSTTIIKFNVSQNITFITVF